MPLPKGLPVLPETAVTVYLVYIARKQWQKVAVSIQNPEDKRSSKAIRVTYLGAQLLGVKLSP